MKALTLADIRDLSPCYDPTKYLPEDWQGTVSDLLKVEDCPAKDRIWVAVHLIDAKTARLFAVWCAREALAQAPSPDPRSIAACDVAERYAHGQATDEERRAARAAARAAEAAWAARAAAYAAADSAAAYAAYAAYDAAAYDAADAARQKQLKKILEMINESVDTSTP